FAGDRMADEARPRDVERIHCDANVLDQALRVVAAARMVGLAEAAPREHDDGRTAAPEVEVVKTHAPRDANESGGVAGGIMPCVGRGGLRESGRAGERRKQRGARPTPHGTTLPDDISFTRR